ncbi:MAG TPA: DUF2142 domain-containing protein [Anaerolineales bacterium]|nr:DUF2142 domain-containing protein [Anaerolineales bacterium]
MKRVGHAMKQIKISGIEIFLIAVLLVFGVIMMMMTPLGAGYDEDQHFNRVWQLAQFRMIPDEMSWQQAKFPQLYIELSYRKQPLVEPVGFDYWERYGKLELYDHGYYYGPLETRSRYNPVLLLPQALAVRYSTWRFELPALSIYYAARLAGLLTYTWLVWLAIRLIPFGKWTLFSMAVAPTAIYQASTVNADTITNGVGILFVAGTLAMADRKEIRFKEWGILILLIAALFLAKPNVYPLVLLPFLSIPPSRFWHKAAYLLLIFCTVALFSIEVVGWNRAAPNPGFTPSGDVNAAQQVNYLLAHPFWFPRVLINDLFLQGSRYLTQWIGVYGYDYGSVPAITYFLFLGGVVMTLLHRDSPNPNRKLRLVLLLVFFLCYAATALSLYLTFTAVGDEFVYGVQGRYLVPILPLLFLALCNLPFLHKLQINAFPAGFFILASIITFTSGLILTYHVTCGSAYYEMKRCYQPFYKNLSPLTVSSPPISEGTVLIQEIVPVCSGMTEIQVRVNSPGQALDGEMEIILSKVKDNSILLHQTVNNGELPTDTWYGMDFDPDWQSAGQRYALTIRGVNSPAGTGPLLAYSIRPEYPLGTLLENGKLLEDDLLFRYGCLAGLQKIWQGVTP